MQEKIKIVVISETEDIKSLQITIENLNNNSCNSNDYVIAVNINDINTKEYCEKMNIRYYSYTKVSKVYNELHKELDYDYITFIQQGDTYNDGFKRKLLRRIHNNKDNIIILPIIDEGNKYILNSKIAKGKNVNIEKNPDKIWIHLRSAFISKEILGKVKLSDQEDIQYYTDKIFLTKLMMLNGEYKIVRNVKLISGTHLENSSESKIECYDISWYVNVYEFIKVVTEFSIREHNINLQYIQYLFMYLIKSIVNENTNMKNKHILVEEKLEEFLGSLKGVLENIDDNIILKIPGNKNVNFYFLRLKHNNLEENIEYRTYLNNIHVVNRNQMIFNATDIKIKVLLMDYVDGYLNITGLYPFPFEEDKLKIYAKYRNENYYAQKNELYSDYKAFGKTLYKNYVFDLKIPLKEINKKRYIRFYIESNKGKGRLDLDFNKPLSRLSNIKNCYWNCGNYSLNYRKKSILVITNTKLRHIKREWEFVKNILKSKNKNAKKAGYIRILYYLTKPFFRKEIWLFEDKVYKAGDNGEYLYTYSSKQKDGIKKYYILRKDCIDAKRFKKEKKKFVKFGSLKHKLLFLNSDIVFTTHNNVTKQHTFDEKIEKYFRDLFNSKNVCIQHGLTVQYIPHLTNRISDNLKQFFLASPIEKKNMSNKEYSYNNDLDVLTITGSPRYDGLKNNDKKQILITPTWRSYLALPSVKYGESRRHNAEFKKSHYYKIYNDLINNKKLIEFAKKTGYKIIYLLHPCTSSQINDFDRNEFVELVAATDDLNYEKILTESSLMVTDYSGVQFDFAYMYKPIIYFHPNELPPSYDEGEYKYETMALGEITKTNQQTVDLLCEYMENECKIKDEFKQRIDKFFKYHDFNNCKRIYEEIMKKR